MGNTTKIAFAIGIFLLAYGYLCRILKIYFFWDSKSFGWIFLIIGLMFYLFDLNRTRRRKGKRTFWVRMGIGFIIFFFVLAGAIFFEFKYNSEPYQVVIEYIKSDSVIKNEIGDVTRFGLIPTGAQAITTINGNEYGKAVYYITVSGNKKKKDVEIKLKKTPETVWTVYLVK